MEFRLRSQLRALHRGTIGAESVVRLDETTTADRDMLRDALRVVRQFRELIRNHYNLGAF
jgi:CBS domain-containing protein